MRKEKVAGLLAKKYMKYYALLIVGFVVLILVVGIWFVDSSKNEVRKNDSNHVLERMAMFEGDGLHTNTEKTSIDLNKVLDGGPGKDGIPALLRPKFESVSSAESYLKDDAQGILVTRGETARYYSYNILAWHEVVNDVVAGMPLVVTFCPLCGSAIVFEAEANDERTIFGVSGKLYESNLLMYDHETESLWAQVLGEALVGERVGEKLVVYPSQVLPFSEIKKRYPQAEVLSRDTGYERDYTLNPYGGYDTDERLYFPITVHDTRLPAKEIIYSVSIGTQSVAFKLADLLEIGKAGISVDGVDILAEIKDGEIEVRDAEGKLLPGYHAMWFSWATHYQEDGVVWQKDKTK